MKLKTAYGLVWGIFGFILSASVVLISYSSLPHFFNNIITNKNTWSPWMHKISLAAAGMLFLYINALFIDFGIKRGVSQHGEMSTVRAKGVGSMFFLIAVFIALPIFVSTAAFYMQNVKSRIDEEGRELNRIKSIYMEYTEDGFYTVVEIDGKVSDGYSLEVDLKSQKYIKEHLLSVSSVKPFDSQDKSFRLFFSFIELADIYHKKLFENIPFLERELGVNEDVEVSFNLRKTRKGTVGFGKDYQEELYGNRRAIAKIYFLCTQNKCEVSLLPEREIGSSEEQAVSGRE